jgi:hypothetical protein
MVSKRLTLFCLLSITYEYLWFELNIEKGDQMKSILSVDAKLIPKIEAQQITQIKIRKSSSSVTNNILFVASPAQEVLDKMGMGAIAPIDVGNFCWLLISPDKKEGNLRS